MFILFYTFGHYNYFNIINLNTMKENKKKVKSIKKLKKSAFLNKIQKNTVKGGAASADMCVILDLDIN